jgi:Uma2 family endonuclease
MIAGAIKMTARQFLELGEDPPGVRMELVDGEVVVTPSPTPGHSNVDVELGTILNIHIRATGLGKLLRDVDTIFGAHDVRRPDILYFSKKRLHLIGETAIEGPPDLCVEIVSPKGTQTDRVEKFEEYEAGKVAHYWIVDPKRRTIEAFKLRRGRYVLIASGKDAEVVRLPPFPDLPIPLADIWLADYRKSRRRRTK